ncbi:MAG: hypothetical protein Pyrs2KO_10370 [Pyruvatibacter sp.]
MRRSPDHPAASRAFHGFDGGSKPDAAKHEHVSCPANAETLSDFKGPAIGIVSRTEIKKSRIRHKALNLQAKKKACAYLSARMPYDNYRKRIPARHTSAEFELF